MPTLALVCGARSVLSATLILIPGRFDLGLVRSRVWTFHPELQAECGWVEQRAFGHGLNSQDRSLGLLERLFLFQGGILLQLLHEPELLLRLDADLFHGLDERRIFHLRRKL